MQQTQIRNNQGKSFGVRGGLSLSSASLLDHGSDSLGGLSAIADPLFNLLQVKGVVLTLSHGVVCTHLFNEVAIAANTAVNDNNLVIRTVLRPLTVETNCYHIVK